MKVSRRELFHLIALTGLGGPLIAQAQLTQSTGRNPAKFVRSNYGSQIAYEVVGTGPTIVLQHGFTSNRGSWRRQGYVDALANRYRLILIDAKGHGESDGPADPDAYSHKSVAEDVAAVVEAECDEPPAFWGYSMGGRIAYSCMAYTPNLYRRFIIGEHYSSIFGVPEEETKRRIARAERFEMGVDALDPAERSRLQDANLPAFAAFTRSSAVPDPTLPAMLRTFEGPTLYYTGDEGAGRLRAREAKHGRRLIDYFTDPTYVEITGGISHLEAFNRADLVLPHVLRFLDRT